MIYMKYSLIDLEELVERGMKGVQFFESPDREVILAHQLINVMEENRELRKKVVSFTNTEEEIIVMNKRTKSLEMYKEALRSSDRVLTYLVVGQCITKDGKNSEVLDTLNEIRAALKEG